MGYADLRKTNTLIKVSVVVVCFFVNCEGETTNEKKPPSNWPVGKSVGIFLFND